MKSGAALKHDRRRNGSEAGCDGNLICEEGEYPGSSDCPDCDDGDKCTWDGYNFSKGTCEHIYNCTKEPAGQGLVITELMYNPVQDDDYNEFYFIFYFHQTDSS